MGFGNKSYIYFSRHIHTSIQNTKRRYFIMVLLMVILSGLSFVICGAVCILYGIWRIKNAVDGLGDKTTKE